MVPTANCNGVPTTDWSCCTSSNPCNTGEGDCDTDSDCSGRLTCGTNNCKATGVSGSYWSSSADCCEGKMYCIHISLIQKLKTKFLQPLVSFCFECISDSDASCNGGFHDDISSCCTRSKPCKEGQGDCDKDYHCESGLVCGKNNCDKSKFPSGNSDCCEKPKGTFSFP